jgi:hypothetical protein
MRSHFSARQRVGGSLLELCKTTEFPQCASSWIFLPPAIIKKYIKKYSKSKSTDRETVQFRDILGYSQDIRISKEENFVSMSFELALFPYRC